jgi:sugar-specific transcriptional regulator TrmB
MDPSTTLEMTKVSMDIGLNQQFEILKNIGLTESEANIYIANITLGPSSIIEIAKKSGLTRQMVYTLMSKLTHIGLIKEINVGKRRMFEANNPDSLKDRVKFISNQINELVPYLKSRQATNSAIPLVTIYENPLAMREWYRGFLKEMRANEEYLVWESTPAWIELDKEFYIKFVRAYEKRKVRDKIIAPDTPAIRALYANELGSKYGQYRFAKGGWGSETAKAIWRDQVINITVRENATNMVVIESKELAALERFNFYRVWDSLK